MHEFLTKLDDMHEYEYKDNVVLVNYMVMQALFVVMAKILVWKLWKYECAHPGGNFEATSLVMEGGVPSLSSQRQACSIPFQRGSSNEFVRDSTTHA